MIIKIPYNIPSQNVTSRRHWTKDNAEKNRCASLISACMRNKFEHQGKVAVSITSVRKKKISDKANLIGGAKYLIDGLVKARAIEDDSDAHVEIIYHQMAVKKGEHPHTIITLNEWVDPQIELDAVKKEFLRLKEIERLAVTYVVERDAIKKENDALKKENEALKNAERQRWWSANKALGDKWTAQLNQGKGAKWTDGGSAAQRAVE